MAWLYVPALEESKEGLNQELMDSKPFVMLRGKPTQLRTLLRKYKKEPFMRLLSGLTFKPSTAHRGVANWILSQEDSRVSPIQVRGSYLDKKTQETYGQTLNESLARFHPGSCSWRTFQTSIIQSAPQSLETWPKWGLTRLGALYALPTLAHPIEERDGLSWQLPTPTTQMNQTCESMNHSKAHRNLKKLLYPTPTASEAEKAGKYKKGQTGNSLVAKAKRGELIYPTPTAREPNDLGLNLDRGRYSNDTLTRKVSNQEGLKTGGRLNPQWVEWLMGWPIGWTDLEGAGTE